MKNVFERKSLLKTVAFCAVLFATAPAHAQLTSGSVSGNILDSQGARVVGAKVTLTDELQAGIRTMNSSSDGTFAFTPVNPSNYTLTVEATGFKKFVQKEIVLDVNEHLELPSIHLEVGTINETISVQANALQLQTESSEKATVLTGEQTVDLPLVDRGFMGLLAIVPGAVGANRYNANVNGARNDELSVKLDGMSNMDSGVNMCCSTWVNPDTIAEFRVVSNAATAEFGHAGGPMISVVTKGGSKQFHGSAYGFLRNESLDTNTFTNNYNGTRKPTYRYNTTGFTVGGPIFIPKKFNTEKNKLFFFASEEYQQQYIGTNTNNKTTPTAAQRLGDFSLTQNGSGVPVVIKDPTTGNPFPGNIIPTNRISHDGQALLNVMPLPNVAGNNSYNYTSAASYHQPDTIGTYRVDDNINDKWRAYVRFTKDDLSFQNPYGESSSFPGIGLAYENRTAWGVAINVTTILSPTWTNEYIMGGSQNLIPQSAINYPNYSRSALGLTYQNLYPNGDIGNVGPQVSFGGVSNAPSLGNNLPNFADNTNFNWVDNMAKIFPKHTVKWGFSIERDRKDQSNGNQPGNVSFGQDNNNPLDSGFAFSNALLGNFDTYSQANAQLTGKYRFTNIEWYIQDTWKVSNKLTLNYGMRFYIVQPIYDAKGQIVSFNPSYYSQSQAVRLYTEAINPATGKVNAYDPVTKTYLPPVYYGAIIPGSGNPNNGFVVGGTNGYPRGLYNNRGVQYGPRLGAAYQVDQKTVVRVGAGIYFDRIEGNTTYSSLSLPPTLDTATIYYSPLSNLQNAGSALFPAGGSAGYAPDGHVPTVYSYNLTVEREVPYHILVSAAYVGQITRHLIELVDINSPAFGSAWLPQNQNPSQTPAYNGTTTVLTNLFRPYIGVANYNLAEWGGTSNYNSLQLTANRRMSQNLTFGVAYTFSKVLGTADSIYNSSANANQNIRATNYGRLSYDVTNNLVINYSYWFADPIRKSAGVFNNPVTRLLFNKWQSSGILSFRSGFPATPSYSVTGQSLANVVTGDPDFGPRVVIVPGANPNGNKTGIFQEFNTSAFIQAPIGSTNNTSSYDYLNLPFVSNLNLTLFKNIPVGVDSRRYFQFRLEGYNALNATQWTGVNTSATFASLTSNTITNLPINLVNGSSVNGGRFGYGAANGVASIGGQNRVMQVALKFYF
jgi:hypothetical protein